MAGLLQYSSILAEKKKSGTFNYLKSVPSDSVLRAQLKDEEYRVTRLNETETAFRNKYWNNTKPGIYVDVIINDWKARWILRLPAIVVFSRAVPCKHGQQ